MQRSFFYGILKRDKIMELSYYQTLFNQIKTELIKEKEKVDKNGQNIESMFNNVYGIYKYENGVVFVEVTDQVAQFRFDRFFKNSINDIAEKLTGEKIIFKFVTSDEVIKEKSEDMTFLTPEKNDKIRGERRLRAEFTFEMFVVGEANRFAYINALQVAQNPNSTLNPLYIFGNVGLGKTHLMMAIGNYILENNTQTNIIYTTAQQFAENFFFYTNDREGKQKIESFYNYYNSADILLVDDIQYLEGKNKTQDEFFKIFDRLYENSKQIIVTSDRKANDLKLMDRLKSRFSWGLEVNINYPDQNLREKIVYSKLSTLIQNPKDVPEEVVVKIASLFTSNIRELEGATRRFITYCVGLDLPFTIENAEIALKDILASNNNVKENYYLSETNDLKKVVSEYFKLPISDLESSTRKSAVVYARNICFYLIREYFKVPLKEIGSFFGNRDHATVAHGIEKIASEMKTNHNIKNDISYLTKKANISRKNS